MIAVFLLLLGQPASQPASAPAGSPVVLGGTAQDIQASVILAYRLGDKEMTVEEFWQLENASGRLVPIDSLQIALPPRARVAVVDEQTPDFEPSEDSKFLVAKSAMHAASKRQIGARYFQGFDGSKTQITRTLPFTMKSVKVIVEAYPGLRVTSNKTFSQHVSDMSGQRFNVAEFAEVEGPFELTITGLPSHSTWPRTLSLAAVALILAWMFYALSKQRQARAITFGPLSARARKDRIVRAIEILDEEFRAEKIKERRYHRRHRELMDALAQVLRELDLAKAQAERNA